MITNGIKVGFDIVKAAFALRKVKNGVAVFGSARTKPDSSLYIKGYELGELLANLGPVITGGGPGVMEAVNMGAIQQKNGNSVGVGILLPREEHLNDYLEVSHICKYFCARKYVITRKSKVFIILPGGVGTLDELAEMLTLILTDKAKKRKVIIFDRHYHRYLLKYITETMVQAGAVTLDELKETLEIADEIGEIIHIIQKFTKNTG